MRSPNASAFAHRSLEHFFELSERHRLQERYIDFAKQLGYTASLAEHVYSSPEAYRVFNLENGSLTLSDNDERIAIIVANHGDKVRYSATPHPFQRADIVTRGMASSKFQIDGAKTAAFVHSPSVAAECGNEMRLGLCSPLVVLVPLQGTDYMCPSVMAHELMHVVQTLDRSELRMPTDETLAATALEKFRFGQELEAYALQQETDEIVQDEFDPYGGFDQAIVVNSIRQKIQGNLLDATETLITALRANGAEIA